MDDLRVPLANLWICNKLSASSIQQNPERTKVGMEWLTGLIENTESTTIRLWAAGKKGSINALMTKKIPKTHLKQKKRRQRQNITKSDVSIEFFTTYIDERIENLSESSNEAAFFVRRCRDNAISRGWPTEKQVASVDQTFKNHGIDQ